MEIGILTAFLAGIVSFLSPCVLPLAPPYLAYLGGTTLDQIAGERDRIDPGVARRVFISACFFVLGLATVFVLLGMGASAFGQILVRYKPEFAFVAGGVIYALGLHFIGLRSAHLIGLIVAAGVVGLAFLTDDGFGRPGLWADLAWLAALSAGFYALGRYWQTDRLPILDREARFDGPRSPGSLGASYVIGLAFAFGWTPCIGPILGAILSLAAQEETLMAGTALLAVYALGLGVPFLIAAAFIGPFLLWAHGFRRHLGRVEMAMGLLLVIVGVAMVTGDFERFAYFLLETFPALATIG